MNTNLTKREVADRILRGLFAHNNRISIADAIQAAGPHGVSRRTIQRAARDLGVREVHNGPYGAFWEQPSDGD
jgi:hypothetical protein